MKDKKLFAMFITSLVAFVASLSISLGVSFAFADHVPAIGLEEVTFTMSTQATPKQVVVDPAGYFTGDIQKEGVFVNTYEDIQYAHESLPDNIKLLKVTVTNDTTRRLNFRFNVDLNCATNALKYTKVKILQVKSNRVYTVIDGTNETDEINLEINESKQFVVAAYVDNSKALEVVNLPEYMLMTLSVVKSGL